MRASKLLTESRASELKSFNLGSHSTSTNLSNKKKNRKNQTETK